MTVEIEKLRNIYARRADDHAAFTAGDGPYIFGVFMSWFLLLIAGLLEVAWAGGLKISDGFTRLLPSVFTIFCALSSFGLLAVAMKELPLGTAYAVWTGIGALGAFILGITIMGEAVTAARLISASMILIGLIGLKLMS